MIFPIAVGAAIYAEYYTVVVVFVIDVDVVVVFVVDVDVVVVVVVGGFLVFIVAVAFQATFDLHIGAKDAAKDESSVLLSEIFSTCFS